MKFKVLVCVALIIMTLIAGCGGNDKANALTSLDPRTKTVRDGHLNDYPDVKIGDAYNEFFKNAQWKYFESDKGEKVVEFSGNCMYKDKEINVRQQFILGEGSSFTVGALAFNEIDQNRLISAALISKVYDEYYKKHPGGNKVAERKTEDGQIQKAQNVLNGKNVQGTVVATSFGNNPDGFLALIKKNNQYSFFICDNKNQQFAEVPFSQEAYNFLANRNQKNAPPLIFNMTIFNDNHDRDEKDGAWNGSNHMIPIYALYKFDQNGNVVPGMLTTGWGAKPSHYQGYLNEQKNVDIANLFLLEMKALQENAKTNQVNP